MLSRMNQEIILQGTDLETTANELISKAIELGGLDNITLVLVYYLER